MAAANTFANNPKLIERVLLFSTDPRTFFTGAHVCGTWRKIVTESIAVRAKFCSLDLATKSTRTTGSGRSETAAAAATRAKRLAFFGNSGADRLKLNSSTASTWLFAAPLTNGTVSIFRDQQGMETVLFAPRCESGPLVVPGPEEVEMGFDVTRQEAFLEIRDGEKGGLLACKYFGSTDGRDTGRWSTRMTAFVRLKEVGVREGASVLAAEKRDGGLLVEYIRTFYGSRAGQEESGIEVSRDGRLGFWDDCIGRLSEFDVRGTAEAVDWWQGQIHGQVVKV